MNELKIIHTADWHADAELTKNDKLVDSLTQMLDYVKENKVNAIIHAGDIWEKKQSYSDKSGVPTIIEMLRMLSKHVDFIFITKGNNSHDEPGSVSLLHQLEPNIYAYEYPVVLAVTRNDTRIIDILNNDFGTYPVQVDYIVSLVPYPTKAMFVKEQSIDLNNNEFVEMFEEVFELIGNVTQPYTCPKILAFHGNVVGSRLSTGQTLVSQDIMVAPKTLQKAKHDYYALGHIHLRQEVAPNMIYSGSIYNKNWGETEQKSFEIIEFVDKTPLSENASIEPYNYPIMLTAARPMITVEAEFTPNDASRDFWVEDNLPNNNPEVRFRCTVKENDRKLLTEDKIEWIKSYFGKDVKIEWNIIPDERESRSESIMHAKTLLEEVEEYAKVVEFELPESIKEKVKSIQENEEVPV